MSATLRAEAIRDVLDRSDQGLYLKRAAGKSLHALAQLYPALGGENGVEARLNDIEIRLQARMREREGRTADEDDSDNSGGLPVKTVAGLDGDARPGKPLQAPPSRPSAPASCGPSREGLDAGAPSPSSPPRASTRDRVLAFLGDRGRCRQMEISSELEIPNGNITGVIDRLARDGLVVISKVHGAKFIELAEDERPALAAVPEPEVKLPGPEWTVERLPARASHGMDLGELRNSIEGARLHLRYLETLLAYCEVDEERAAAGGP